MKQINFVIKEIERLKEMTKIKVNKLLIRFGISQSTYYGWLGVGELKKHKKRSLTNITEYEKQAVLEFKAKHKNIGYRHLTWLMNDADVAYLSESSVYRVLKAKDKLGISYKQEPTAKEYKNKPQYVHHHWHTDISYIKAGNKTYYLIMLLDGFSRYLLGWDLMTDMTNNSVESFISKVKEQHPDAKPMLIHDNGSQFISKDFKYMCSKLNLKQVRARPHHPQTNGKIERLNYTVKYEGVKPESPLNYKQTYNAISNFAYFYNHKRLHHSLNFLTPYDVSTGNGQKILDLRKKKMRKARKQRILFNKLNLCNNFSSKNYDFREA